MELYENAECENGWETMQNSVYTYKIWATKDLYEGENGLCVGVWRAALLRIHTGSKSKFVQKFNI